MMSDYHGRFKKITQLFFAVFAVLALVSCGYVKKKIEHKKDSSYAPSKLVGKSFYGSVTNGYLNFHQKVTADSPKNFKTNFLPDQKFRSFDKNAGKTDHFHLEGVYQYKKNSGTTATLVINFDEKSEQDVGYGNFSLTFKTANKGSFTAKLYNSISNEHYEQSGTFKLGDY